MRMCECVCVCVCNASRTRTHTHTQEREVPHYRAISMELLRGRKKEEKVKKKGTERKTSVTEGQTDSTERGGEKKTKRKKEKKGPERTAWTF